MTGSHEVRGSIPRSSTRKIKGLKEIESTVKAGFTATLQQPVAPPLTVVTSTSAQSGVAMHAMAARAAWVASNAAAARETTTTLAHSSNAR